MLTFFQLELLKLKQRDMYLDMIHASRECSPRIVLCQIQLLIEVVVELPSSRRLTGLVLSFILSCLLIILGPK